MAADDDTRVEAASANESGMHGNDHVVGDEKNVHADKAAQFVVENQNYPPMTPQMEKRIKRKIDGWMIPLVRFLRNIPMLIPRHTSNSTVYSFSSLPPWQPSTKCSCPLRRSTTFARTTI